MPRGNFKRKHRSDEDHKNQNAGKAGVSGRIRANHFQSLYTGHEGRIRSKLVPGERCKYDKLRHTKQS